MHPIFQVVYLSESIDAMNEAELQKLLECAREKNLKQKTTASLFRKFFDIQKICT